MTDREDALRRYLLGSASEEESTAIERHYFTDSAALDGVSAAEESLIDDYLSERLAPEDRQAFEQHYLASPTHRARVDVARRLQAVTSTASNKVTWRPIQWAAAAALLVAVAGSAVWMIRPPREAAPPATSTAAPPPGIPAQAGQPRKTAAVFVLLLTPISVRGGGDQPTVRVPPGADVVAVDLSAEPNEPALKGGTAIVRTVSGEEVWRGPVNAGSTPAILARAEIPSERLPANDYIVELLEVDGRGRSVERHRYFLRLRRE